MHSLLRQEDINIDTMLLHPGPVPLLSYHLFEPYSDVVTNVISTRRGGVSTPPYDTLNLSLSSRDDQNAVVENRRRLAEAAQIDLNRLTIAQLIQGTHIGVVTQELLECDTSERLEKLKDTDGLITAIPGAPLAVLVADCTVVSFFDPTNKAVALAHAGWRGTAGNIICKTVEMLNRTYGCDPADILTGISPNMSGDTFHVKHDVLDVFCSRFGDGITRFFRQQTDSTYRLDLNEILLWQLEECSIRREQIEIAGIDTYARTDLFFSHRAEGGKTGRFCGLIVLRQ